MKPLYERARPTSFDEVVGCPDVIQRLNVMREKGGLGGRAYFISGESGQGKTTIARLIAREIADPYAIVERDAQDLTLEFLRDIEESCKFRPIGKGWHVYIFNEIHGARTNVISKLLTVLENKNVQRTGTIIFTTTNQGQQHLFDTKFDSLPFLSRCIRFNLDARGKELEFALRAREIAQAEDLDGQPLDVYLDLAKKHRCNMRGMLCDIESGALIAK